jgi:radical SAM superfamily enzyme YgiQ (UPF0313 family)
MPAGFAGLANYGNRSGAETRILHLGVELSLDSDFSIERFLQTHPYKNVGVSLHWAKSAVSVIELAERIKKCSPETFVFLGGFTASYFPLEILSSFRFIDAVVCGEAEGPLASLLQGRELADIPNLTWRDKAGAIQRNPLSYQADQEMLSGLDHGNLDVLYNCAHYHPKNWSKFRAVNDRKTFFTSFGRGCVYSCTYCGGNRRTLRRICGRDQVTFMSPEAAVRYCRALNEKYGYTSIYNGYAPFPNNPEVFFAEFVERVRAEGLQFVYCHEAWGLPSQDFLRMLKDAFPVLQVGISAESGVERVRRENKSKLLFFTNRQLEETLQFMGDNGILGLVYFSYFHPTESEDDLARSIEYFMRLRSRYQSFCQFSYFPLTTDPGALVQENPDRFRMVGQARTFSDYLSQIRRLNEQDLMENLALLRPAHLDEASVRRIFEAYPVLLAYRLHTSPLRDAFLK